MRGFFHDLSVWLQQHFLAIEVLTWAFALAALAYSGLQYYSLSQEYAAAKEELASTTSAYSHITLNWQDKFEQAVGKNQELASNLNDVQNQNLQMQAQLNGTLAQVDQLTVLSHTDKELLEKYSKVFFLSDNYTPASTSTVDSKYVFDTARQQSFLTKAYPFLQRMIDGAAASSTQLKIISAFRSFGQQATLKSEYKMTYGAGANAFSADQGYSEHQLGTAVDLTTQKIGNDFSNTKGGFDSSDGYKWMSENAYKYGFVLSYPKGNSYYQYEPWHWRFVGVALATRLHNDSKNFYDLDQREIDGYLALMFN
jgi:LAS superfamily LD-carboxypeptidase LdcB